MLAAGNGLKLSDFGGICFNFNKFARKLNGVFFCIFYVRYNVSFIEIICISMPHRLNIFLAIFMKYCFLAFKNLKKEILKIKITAIFFTSFFKHPILQTI